MTYDHITLFGSTKSLTNIVGTHYNMHAYTLYYEHTL